MKRFILILLWSSIFSPGLFGQERALKEIKIGILTPFKPTSGQVIVESGTYNVWADGDKIAVLAPRERITFIRRDRLVELSIPGKVLGNFKAVDMLATDSSGIFRLFVLKPNRAERVYDDHLLLTATSHGVLKFINKVNLEKYIAGVVEAESGKEKGLEFYMAQAVISRTYALNNRRRFLREGYHLNDLVDCQVYHGKARWEPEILQAVEATASLVLVDSEMRLITAAFHSNSGGETVGSETVWSGPLPYLISRKDEFSIGGDHYLWQKSVPLQAWLAYLKDKYGYDTGNEALRGLVTEYAQPYRKVFFLDDKFQIPLKDIRKDWTLNSTYFDIEMHADSILFKGRGFGHGAGLSQEGAMRMADLGFPYNEILHFYYNDVHIIDLRNLEFFIAE
jgi:stage II sporulation protein D